MKNLIILLATFFFGIAAGAQTITGDWYGNLEVQGQKLPLVLHIFQNEKSLSATMDSPAQGGFDIPVSSISFTNDSLKLQVASIGMNYEAKLNENKELVGTFRQGMLQLPLKFSKEQGEQTQLKRPQEPKEPYPYHTEDVIFRNEKSGIKLAGTLSTPKGKKKFPAVILISGSGPQDRDETLMGHKPFLVIADYLTRNGIAVLRFDDKGVGQSEGDFAAATTSDFATDVEAAVNFLKSKNHINEIGLVGHSEGGAVAPMVANTAKEVDFLALLAAPGLRGDHLMLLQKERIEQEMGVPEMQVAMSQNIFRGAYNKILESEKSAEALREEVRQYFKNVLGGRADEETIDQLSEQLTTPWMLSFLRYDPKPALEKVNIPVLAMNGEKDLQVPPAENLKAIEEALKTGGNKNVIIKEFENLNHLFQESETGLPNEYGQIEQTFSPVALEFMTQWIKEQVR